MIRLSQIVLPRLSAFTADQLERSLACLQECGY